MSEALEKFLDSLLKGALGTLRVLYNVSNLSATNSGGCADTLKPMSFETFLLFVVGASE